MRNKRSASTEEKINLILAEIEKTEKTLADLRAKKKELEQKKKDEDLKELYDIVQKSGKTLADVKAMLEKETK